jgi:anti-sigma factor RsiW
MNDLPQNELLSAYLDGELTTAEQAEMERLLAQSPAARQLLEELRSMRSMLQALPQEKLTEDLSRQVLRVAERRMLTEEEPGAAEDGPMALAPLGRSLFKRFLSRRTMAWLAVTAAVLIMVRISERWQNLRPIADVDKEVALAKPAQPPQSSGPPPTMQAPGYDRFKAGHAVAAKQASQAVKQASQAANVGESVSVVRCNISADAAQKQVFEKLLDANGVVWRQRPDPSLAAGAQKEQVSNKAKQLQSDRSLAWRSLAAGSENLVEVEATTAQLDATLAGLKAQPDLFRSFSVKPGVETHNEETFSEKTSAPVADRKERSSSSLAGESSQLAAPPPSKAEQPVQRRLQRQSAVVPSARQQVLFVLHVVGDHPPAAAKALGGMKINAAKPAEQAAPPAKPPKPQK